MIWLRYWPIISVLIGMYVLESGWAAILLYHAGILLGAWLKREQLRSLHWKSPPGLVIAMLVSGLIAIPAGYFLTPLLTSPTIGTELSGQLARLGLQGNSFFLFFAYFILLHPLIEETGWRGVLFTRKAGLHIHDVEFAAYHLVVLHWIMPDYWFLLVATFVTLTVSAWFWRQLRDRKGMAAVVAFHGTADFGVLTAVAWLAGRF